MAEPRVMDALREKRSELSGIVSHLEQQIVHHRVSLVHLDAAMRLFGSRPCARGDQLPVAAATQHLVQSWRMPAADPRRAARGAAALTTRALTEQVMGVKAIPATDERSCALVQKTVLGSLGRAKATIQCVEAAGVVSWRIG